MSATLVSFMVTLLIAVLLVCTKRWHGRFSLDSTIGIQKCHSKPTPRIGGVAVYLGMSAGYLVAPREVQNLLGVMLLAGLPAFLFGLLEDLTKRVGVLTRLLATMSSGALICIITGVAMQNTGVAPFDLALQWFTLAVVFTAFAVGGVANAVNIIDGFNGLAGGAAAIMLGTIGLIASQVGDIALANLCWLLMAVALGFCAVNWPMGYIFLGDGGAYLVGFMLAWVAVLLPMRNPTLTAWTTLLVCTYPVLEVLFSVLRRARRGARQTGQPDNLHLHHLIKQRFVRHAFESIDRTQRSGLTSMFCWIGVAIPALWAVAFAQKPFALMLGFVLSAWFYWGVYTFLNKIK